MYYTPVGGDIMFVEVSTMTGATPAGKGGRGDLVLTGQLGDVMKESARAAWTYARAHADSLGIPEEAFARDVHVHVPAGAVPKDGPSAGVTMATALVSALSGRPARHDVAMTGEITLSGRVLPIGGLKNKLLGATRAGIRRFAIPKANAADLDDLPEGSPRDDRGDAGRGSGSTPGLRAARRELRGRPIALRRGRRRVAPDPSARVAARTLKKNCLATRRSGRRDRLVSPTS